MSDCDKDHPDKSTGAWCGDCGAALRPNVPRLGFAAGAIHAKTGRLDCKDAPPDVPQVTFTASGSETQDLRDQIAALIKDRDSAISIGLAMADFLEDSVQCHFCDEPKKAYWIKAIRDLNRK